MRTTPQRPVHELRLGAAKAAIWRNTVEGGPRFSVTFSRIYKSGSEWKSSGSFGRSDLLVLAKLADLAHTFICGAEKDSSAAESCSPDPNRRPRRD